MVVLDASVILKWWRPEEHHRRVSLEFRERFIEGWLTISVPSLVYFEVVSAMAEWRWPMASRIEIIRALRRMGLKTFPEREWLLTATMEVMDSYGPQMRDACYVALGAVKGWPLVTADRRAWRRVSRLGFVYYLPQVADVRQCDD